MKKLNKIFAGLATVIFMSGCATPNYQGNLDCNLPVQEMARKTLDILEQEKYTILTASDIMITAESEEWFKVFQGMQRISWVIRIQENKIIGTASLITRKVGDSQASDMYTLNDDAGENLTEYWRVRRKLEKICNNTMIIIDTRKTVKTDEDDEFKK